MTDMRKLVRERKSNIEYSLHDSRIKEISLEGNTLILEVDTIYQYKEGCTHGYEAKIVFHECDLEECNVMIFNLSLSREAILIRLS